MSSGSAPEPDADPPQEDSIVRRHRGLFSRTLLVSGLTLVSRILGFARETLAAALFGSASPIFDAFLTAWRVPNLFRRFLGEGALSTSLQTAMTEADGDGGDAAGRALFRSTLRLVTVLLVLVSAATMLLIYLTPDTMPVTGWSWLGEPAAPVRELAVRVMPFVVLVCLSALCTGALHVRGEFRAPALGPVAMNIAWLAALVVVGLVYGWTGDLGVERQLGMARLLVWGVLVAGVVQLLVQVPALFRAGLLGAPRGPSSTGASHASAKSVLKASLPLALGAAVYQINVMVDGLMAEGLLADGGPTALYLANRVQQFPLALIAVAATSSVFPALKALGHLGRRDELRSLHDQTQFAVAFLAVPAGVGLMVLAEPIATVLFRHGAYEQDGILRIAAALRFLALALLPAGAVGLVSRSYYALNDFVTPVRVSIAMLTLNIGLNALFVVGLGLDTEGLALATALTSWGNLLILLPGLKRRLGLPAAEPGWVGRLARIVLASLGSGAAAHFTWAALAGWLVPESGPGAASLVALAGAAALGVASFAILAAVLRIPEWQSFLVRLSQGRR